MIKNYSRKVLLLAEIRDYLVSMDIYCAHFKAQDESQDRYKKFLQLYLDKVLDGPQFRPIPAKHLECACFNLSKVVDFEKLAMEPSLFFEGV